MNRTLMLLTALTLPTLAYAVVEQRDTITLRVMPAVVRDSTELPVGVTNHAAKARKVSVVQCEALDGAGNVADIAKNVVLNVDPGQEAFETLTFWNLKSADFKFQCRVTTSYDD